MSYLLQCGITFEFHFGTLLIKFWNVIRYFSVSSFSSHKDHDSWKIELQPSITKGVKIYSNQDEAFKGADFIYAKNWCSYENYGKVLRTDDEWIINDEKMNYTNNAKFMHCLPIRRNVVASDDVLDDKNSLVMIQSRNRVFATQAILKQIIDDE